MLVGGFRAALRRGEDLSPSPSPNPSASTSTSPPVVPQKAALVAVPLFHVTGSTSYSVGPLPTPSQRYLTACDYPLDDGDTHWHENHLDEKMGCRGRSAPRSVATGHAANVYVFSPAVKLIKRENVAVAGG